MILLFQTITAENALHLLMEKLNFSVYSPLVCLFVCLFEINPDRPSWTWPKQDDSHRGQNTRRADSACKIIFGRQFSCKIVNVSSRKHDKAESVRSYLCTAAPFLRTLGVLGVLWTQRAAHLFLKWLWLRTFLTDCEPAATPLHFHQQSVQTATREEPDWGEPEEHLIATRSQ